MSTRSAITLKAPLTAVARIDLKEMGTTPLVTMTFLNILNDLLCLVQTVNSSSQRTIMMYKYERGKATCWQLKVTQKLVGRAAS